MYCIICMFTFCQSHGINILDQLSSEKPLQVTRTRTGPSLWIHCLPSCMENEGRGQEGHTALCAIQFYVGRVSWRGCRHSMWLQSKKPPQDSLCVEVPIRMVAQDINRG